MPSTFAPISKNRTVMEPGGYRVAGSVRALPTQPALPTYVHKTANVAIQESSGFGELYVKRYVNAKYLISSAQVQWGPRHLRKSQAKIVYIHLCS